MNLLATRLIRAAAVMIVASVPTLPAYCQQLVATGNNLPPCNLDSFVYQAGAQAEMIYGDEGVGLPPLFGFTQASRIDAGITGINDLGLTTGHGSYMPSATGADEFLAPPGEWDQSGTNHGNLRYNNAAAALDAADQASAAIAAANQAASAAAASAMLSNEAAMAQSSDGGDGSGDGSDSDQDDAPDPNAYQGGSNF